jgi:hypothetical protein
MLVCEYPFVDLPVLREAALPAARCCEAAVAERLLRSMLLAAISETSPYCVWRQITLLSASPTWTAEGLI